MKKKHYERPHSQGVFLHPESLIATSGGNGTANLPTDPDGDVDNPTKVLPNYSVPPQGGAVKNKALTG